MAAQWWLVVYDIADQRLRTRLHGLLGGFGEAVQKVRRFGFRVGANGQRPIL